MSVSRPKSQLHLFLASYLTLLSLCLPVASVLLQRDMGTSERQPSAGTGHRECPRVSAAMPGQTLLSGSVGDEKLRGVSISLLRKEKGACWFTETRWGAYHIVPITSLDLSEGPVRPEPRWWRCLGFCFASFLRAWQCNSSSNDTRGTLTPRRSVRSEEVSRSLRAWTSGLR